MIVCPVHPGDGMCAIEQATYLQPCYIEKIDDGSVEVEISDAMTRHTMESVVIAYTCANEECGYTLTPDELHDYAPLPKTIPVSPEEDEAWGFYQQHDGKLVHDGDMIVPPGVGVRPGPNAPMPQYELPDGKHDGSYSYEPDKFDRQAASAQRIDQTKDAQAANAESPVDKFQRVFGGS